MKPRRLIVSRQQNVAVRHQRPDLTTAVTSAIQLADGWPDQRPPEAESSYCQGQSKSQISNRANGNQNEWTN